MSDEAVGRWVTGLLDFAPVNIRHFDFDRSPSSKMRLQGFQSCIVIQRQQANSENAMEQ